MEQIDLSIFNKFKFERQPVGVKFLMTKPIGIEKLSKKFAFCEMISVAQKEGSFYAIKDDFECMAGPRLLGMLELPPYVASGQAGPRLGICDDARVNRRIIQCVPVLTRDSVRYVAFSPLYELSFDPDLLIITANVNQAEIVLRAASYKTGEIWHSRGTIVIGCAWLFIYPYVSGELNFMISGLYHGMKARHILPEGLIIISIPYDLLHSIVDNLQQIKWELPQYIKGKEAHVQNMKNLAKSLEQEFRE